MAKPRLFRKLLLSQRWDNLVAVPGKGRRLILSSFLKPLCALPERITSCRRTLVWCNSLIRASKPPRKRPSEWPTRAPKCSPWGCVLTRCIGHLVNMSRCAFSTPRTTRRLPASCWRRTCWATSAREQCVLSQPPRWRESCPRCPDLLTSKRPQRSGRRHVARKRNARPLRIEYEGTLYHVTSRVITLATAAV
jgi:hypothetical protein